MKSDEIIKANQKHLAVFEKWLQGSGLSKKTIDNHVTNVGFYINDFLCGYFEKDIAQGCYEVGRFLGDWFIRKATWSSCAHIKGNAASFKKFYACMLENGAIKQENYNAFCETIKEDMSTWLDEMKRYEAMDDVDFSAL